jgi:hypothetical protein
LINLHFHKNNLYLLISLDIIFDYDNIFEGGIKLKEEELVQILSNLVNGILNACSVQVVDESTRREIIQEVIWALKELKQVYPEATISFTVRTTKPAEKPEVKEISGPEGVM